MNHTIMVDLLKAKDPKGLDMLLKHYRPLMYYIITPILADPDDRDDCISEISIRIWEKIHLYDPQKGNFLNWFTAFVKNTAINQWKKKSKNIAHEELTNDIPSKALTPEEVVLKKEREEQLLKALNKLSKQERLIFYRKYYYMQTTEQIALESGTTVRAIEGKLYRIKKKLRKYLGGDFYE